MSESTTVILTTQDALNAIAYERAPRRHGRPVNQRVVCADGFKISVQASVRHYANDSHPSGEAPCWRSLDDEQPTWPFTTFELGNPSDEVIGLDEWDSGGIWAWVPREAVINLLLRHGGAVAWEAAA